MTETKPRETDIDAALNQAREAYVTSAPRSLARFLQAAAAHLRDDIDTIAPFPQTMVQVENGRIRDADGRVYVDFRGGDPTEVRGSALIHKPDETAKLAARGDVLRHRLNALCQCAHVSIRFAEIGSVLAVQARHGQIRSRDQAEAKLAQLFLLGMLARGLCPAPSGTITLSLPIGDAECDALVAALQGFLAEHRLLLAEEAR